MREVGLLRWLGFDGHKISDTTPVETSGSGQPIGRRVGGRATATATQAGRDGARHLKKSLEHFQPSDLSASYRFIADEAGNYPVLDLCRTLEVSRSGYYEWASRPDSPDHLAGRVSQVFWRHSRRYGSRRIAAELPMNQRAPQNASVAAGCGG